MLVLQHGKLFPCEGTLATTDVAEQLGAGTTTFEAKAKFLEIGYVDYDTYIALTEAELAAAADGSKGGRVFVKAGTFGRIIPWGSRSVWVINKNTGETPAIYLVGMG